MKNKILNNNGSILLSTMMLLMVISFLLVALHTSVLLYYNKSIDEQHESQAYLSARSVVNTIIYEIEKESAGSNKNGVAYLEEIVKFNNKKDKIDINYVELSEFNEFLKKDVDTIEGWIKPTKFYDHGEGTVSTEGISKENTLSMNNQKIICGTAGAYSDYIVTNTPEFPDNDGVEISVSTSGTLNIIWDNPKNHAEIPAGNITLMNSSNHRKEVFIPKIFVMATPKVEEIEISVTATIDGNSDTVNALVGISVSSVDSTDSSKLENGIFYFDKFDHSDEDLEEIVLTDDSSLIIGEDFTIGPNQELKIEGSLYVKGNVIIDSEPSWKDDEESEIEGGLYAEGNITLNNVEIEGEVITPYHILITGDTDTSEDDFDEDEKDDDDDIAILSSDTLEVRAMNTSDTELYAKIHANEILITHNCLRPIEVGGEVYLGSGSITMAEERATNHSRCKETFFKSDVYTDGIKKIILPKEEIPLIGTIKKEIDPFKIGKLEVFSLPFNYKKPVIVPAERVKPYWAAKYSSETDDVISKSNQSLTGGSTYKIEKDLKLGKIRDLHGKPVFIIVQDGVEVTVNSDNLPSSKDKPLVYFILEGNAKISLEFSDSDDEINVAIYGGTESRVELKSDDDDDEATVNGCIIAGNVSTSGIEELELNETALFTGEAPNDSPNNSTGNSIILKHNRISVGFKEYVE